MLKITKIKVRVEEKLVVDGMSLEIEPGEVVVLMGPNGSGKSSLAYAVCGHPKYVSEGKISLDGLRIDDKEPEKRALAGLFLAMQSPVAVPGLKVFSFLRQIYRNRHPEAKLSVAEFRQWLVSQANSLGLGEEFLERSLNDGFSGGERKKMEIMQMLVFGPKYVILDEIDSGLDVEALQKIAKTLASVAKKGKMGVLVITHYSRLLRYLPVDRVVVMKKGKIVIEGGREIVERIDKVGFDL